MQKIIVGLITTAFVFFVGISSALASDRVHDLKITGRTASKLVVEASLKFNGYDGGEYAKLFYQDADLNNEYQVASWITHPNNDGDDFTKYSHLVTGLKKQARYAFIIKVYNSSNQVIDTSASVVQATLDDDPAISAVYPQHALPGDVITIYGNGFGEEDAWLYRVGFDDEASGLICRPSVAENGFGCFAIQSWSDTKIVAKVRANMPQYSSKVVVKKTYDPTDDDKYYDLFEAETSNKVEILHSPAEVSRTISSNYQGDSYLYLYNALAFRYNSSIKRNLTTEQAAAVSFRERMRQQLGRDIGVDALWFLNLFYARYYGGYSDTDVVNEVQHGPCAVHVTIPKEVWKNTANYRNCGL